MKIAVIGTGSIGKTHLSRLKELEGVEVFAISKRSNPREALNKAIESGVEGFVIASDTGLHIEDALSVLSAAKGILIEKPLAPRAEEAEALLKEAGSKKSAIFVGCALRFSESLLKFKEWLPRVGALRQTEIVCQSYLPDWRPDRDYQKSYSARKNEGGVLRDLIHEVDLAGWLFEWPEKAKGFLENRNELNIESDEVAHLQWQNLDGNNVTIDLDYLTRKARRGIKVMGEKGTLSWNALTQEVVWEPTDGEVETFQGTQSREELFADQTKAFVQFLKSGNPSQMATLEEGMKALEVCEPLWKEFE